jgi:hypothetical protein
MTRTTQKAGGEMPMQTDNEIKPDQGAETEAAPAPNVPAATDARPIPSRCFGNATPPAAGSSVAI